jgi:hypothetical protein
MTYMLVTLSMIVMEATPTSAPVHLQLDQDPQTPWASLVVHFRMSILGLVPRCLPVQSHAVGMGPGPLLIQPGLFHLQPEYTPVHPGLGLVEPPIVRSEVSDLKRTKNIIYFPRRNEWSPSGHEYQWSPRLLKNSICLHTHLGRTPLHWARLLPTWVSGGPLSRGRDLLTNEKGRSITDKTFKYQSPSQTFFTI